LEAVPAPAELQTLCSKKPFTTSRDRRDYFFGCSACPPRSNKDSDNSI